MKTFYYEATVGQQKLNFNFEYETAEELKAIISSLKFILESV